LWKAKKFYDCNKYLPLCEKLIRQIIKKSEELEDYLPDFESQENSDLDLAQIVKMKNKKMGG
jgi:hypothetical protein